MPEHTLEPWSVFDHRKHKTRQNGGLVGPDGEELWGGWDSTMASDDDLDRIVLCVNACRGILKSELLRMAEDNTREEITE